MQALPSTHQPTEHVSVVPWTGTKIPARILVIRIQALGDLFACFPVLSALKSKHPEIELDLLCREDYAELPASLGLFRKIHLLKGGTSGRKQLLRSLQAIPALRREGYDMVLDLQRNRQSRLIRKALRPRAHVEFDRFSPFSVLLRYRWSVEQAGFGAMEPNYAFARAFMPLPSAFEKLRKAGWKEGEKWIVLNPAGFSETRNWPLAHYLEWIDRWSAKDPGMRFLLMGVEKLKEKSDYLHTNRPDAVIDLVGETTLSEMYTLLLQAELILSEDSGLGHIAWLSGKKTVILLGSTRADWARPVGTHTLCFDSSHLPCGNCMQFSCPLGTNTCMVDLQPSLVFEKAWQLWAQ